MPADAGFIPAVGEFRDSLPAGDPKPDYRTRVVGRFFGNHDWPVASPCDRIPALLGDPLVYQYYNVRNWSLEP